MSKVWWFVFICSGSILLFRQNITLSLPSYIGSDLKRELNFFNGYLSLLYFWVDRCARLKFVILNSLFCRFGCHNYENRTATAITFGWYVVGWSWYRLLLLISIHYFLILFIRSVYIFHKLFQKQFQALKVVLDWHNWRRTSSISLKITVHKWNLLTYEISTQNNLFRPKTGNLDTLPISLKSKTCHAKQQNKTPPVRIF